MRDEYIDMLRRHGKLLLENISLQKYLLTILKTKGVIDDIERRRIKAGEIEEDQVQKLLDILPKKDNGAFDKFCSALVDDGQEHIETVLLTPDTNFPRYQKLVTEYGSKMLRRILENCLSPKTLQEWLQENEDVFRERLWGREKWIRKVLYPESGSVQLADLDITTLISVFTKLLDDFPPPQNGWFQEPDPTDLTQAADLLRLAKLRNNLAHSIMCHLSKRDFEAKWTEAEEVIMRLGGSDRDIRRLKFTAFRISF